MQANRDEVWQLAHDRAIQHGAPEQAAIALADAVVAEWNKANQT